MYICNHFSLKMSVVLLLIFVMNACSDKKPNLPKSQDYTIIEQTDNPYNNGFKHGSILKTEIAKQMMAWEKNLIDEMKITFSEAIKIVYEETGFLRAIKKYSPELLDEIHGIADGSGFDRKLILAFNLGEEIYNYQNQPTERCSNFAFSNDNGNALIYNQDLPPFLHINKPLILKHKNSLIFSLPGMIGLSGVSKSLALSCNSLPMLQMNKDGLPLVFAIRDLLTENKHASAIAYINSTPFAIPQNLLLASDNEIVGFEVSKNSVSHYTSNNKGLLYHTNFPIYNQDYKYEDYKSSNCLRFDAIENYIQKEEGFDEESLIKAFSTKPLDNSETFLRFLVRYPEDKSSPIVKFVNPQKSRKVHLLKLN